MLVSTVPLDLLLPRLRELGAAPVVEAEDGTVHVVRPDQRRARTPREHRGRGAASARRTATVSAVVTAIRVRRPRRVVPADRPELALDPVRLAGRAARGRRERRPVLIVYVDNHGTRSERVVDPVSVEGGVLTAHDQRADDVRTFAVHRITAVKTHFGLGAVSL